MITYNSLDWEVVWKKHGRRWVRLTRMDSNSKQSSMCHFYSSKYPYQIPRLTSKYYHFGHRNLLITYGSGGERVRRNILRFKSTNPHHVLEFHVLESLLLRAFNMFKESSSVATCVSSTPLTGPFAVWFEINNCFGHVWSHLKFMVVDRKPSKVHKTPVVY